MDERSLKNMINTDIAAVDADIGRCKDCLFEEHSWVLRYLVVDTHKWLPFGRKLVVSPISVDLNQTTDDKLFLKLTREQIKNSPPLAEHEPISRKYEKYLFQYYGYGQYWLGSGPWGAYARPDALIESEDLMSDKAEMDSHLRSVQELEHYRVKCGEHTAGHIVDFVFNDETWSISAAVIDTENWPRGRGQHLLPVSNITSVEWLGRCIHTDLAPDKIVLLPEPETTL